MSERRKTLRELTIKDNFMFGAVMAEEENCRGFLELALEMPIERVELIREKSLSYHPEYRGVRLDIYARDQKNIRYNVEMQVKKTADLGKRSSFYHSQMNMEMLASGKPYTELADSFVIFLCDFDPFGENRYRYTFQNTCDESKTLRLGDGKVTMFLSTKGRNGEEVPPSLVNFLKYAGADLEESQKDFQDDLVKQFQESVSRVKTSREMEEKFMVLEEMLREERREGQIEGEREGRIAGEKAGRIAGRSEGRVQGKTEDILSFLTDLGAVPEELSQKILREKDLSVLSGYLKLAARAESLEQFRKETGL
ncbi:MAG: Rpn family recombination-promoting nuclease/putative transposase [Ruminococcus sp.]|jgi:predicted transposase/invertase (TIGR01784 family)